jgi:RHS repeat-associated protein
VSDASDRTITFTYNSADRIQSATDPMNQTWLYRYSAAGDLTEIENPAGEIWRYTYNAHRITSLTDPDNELMYTNTYVGSTGKVAGQADGENKIWTFTYNTGNTRVLDPTGVAYTVHYDTNFRTTRIVDDAGHETRSIYDAASNRVAVVDPSGLEARFAYNEDGTLRASLDATDHKTAYTYDNDGQLTSVTDLKGNTTSYTYDPSGRPATITTPTGETTTLTYRTDGQVDTVTDDTGATTRYDYTPNGLLASVTDPLNRATTITLRADGLPTSITNAADETVTYTYDKANRVTTVKNPELHSTSFGYDGRGMRTSVTDPRNHTTSYGYDARGLLTSVTDPLNRTTTFGYDDARRLTSRTDPRNLSITRSYDSLGRLELVNLPDQPDTTVTYDDDGRTATITDGTGTTSYDYDTYGRLVAERRDLENATLSYRYDVLGRRSTLELHRGPILAARNIYSYDASGRVTQLIDSTGGETRFDYDRVGRLASVGHANGSVTSYTYDPAGQITQLLNLPEGLLDLQGDADPPLQAATNTLASLNLLANHLTEPANVTALENIVSELQKLVGNLSAGGANIPTIVQLLGDLADTTEALDAAIGELLDPETLTALETLVADLGETLASLPNSIQADQATDLAEDLATLSSELTATATGLSNEIDLLGDLLVNILRLARKIVLGGSIDPELDATLDNIGTLAAGLPEDLEQINATVEALAAVLTDLTGAGGGLQSAWNYTYDPAGRTTQAIRRFVTTNNEQLRFTNTYAYDAAGQLTAATTTDPAVLIGGNVNYTYDPAGNRTQVAIAGTVPIDYTYDAANQLTSDTLHTYSHDAAGNLSQRASAGQAALATSYGFDSLNRLVDVQDPTGRVVDHTYDNAGRRVSTTTTDPAGNVATDTYLYDGWDLLNTVSTTGDTAYTTVDGRVLAATTALGDTHYHPDATGNIGEATDDNGNVITRNAYTPYGATTPIPPSLDPDNAATMYGYSGAWGVRDAGDGLLDMRNRTYDPTLGQFLSRDPLEATTGDAYNYAANNPIDLTDPTGLAPGISVSINISTAIAAVPQPRPQYNAPMSCARDYGLCEAIATSPPGSRVSCSATFGCRYYLDGQEFGCFGADCGFHPGVTSPVPSTSGGGQSVLCSAARFLGWGDGFRAVTDVWNGDFDSAQRNVAGVAATELNGATAGQVARQLGPGMAKRTAGGIAKVLGAPVSIAGTLLDPVAC